MGIGGVVEPERLLFRLSSSRGPEDLEAIEPKRDSSVSSVTSGNYYVRIRTRIAIWDTKTDQLRLFTASNPSEQDDSGLQESCLFLWILRLPPVHPLQCNVEARIL